MPFIQELLPSLNCSKEVLINYFKLGSPGHELTTDTYNIGDEVYLLTDAYKRKWTITKFVLSAKQERYALLENGFDHISVMLTDIAYCNPQ